MTDVLFARHRVDPLHERAISDELIDALPGRHLSFDEGDLETFARLMRIDLSRWPKSKVSAWKGKIGASGGGVVVKRFDVLGSSVAPPYARLDRDVYFARGKALHYAYRPQYGRTHIDVHPLSRVRSKPLRWAQGSEVYFCLEGSFKADAVLSAGWPSFSSTSITTWESPELKKMLPALREAQIVYVVADSDFYASEKFHGYFNPAVLYYTRLAAQWLHHRGVTVKIAIPWCQEAEAGKSGVDDFLALGYRLGELILEDPIANGLSFMPSIPMGKTEERFLRYLLKYQGTRGAFQVGVLAKRLKVHRSVIWETYRKLEDKNVLRIWQGFPIPNGTGGWINAPHGYVAFELIEGYRDFIKTLHMPRPVARKLRMSEWSQYHDHRDGEPTHERPPVLLRRVCEMATNETREAALELLRKGVNQSEVGRLLDVHRNTVGRWAKAAGLTNARITAAADDQPVEIGGSPAAYSDDEAPRYGEHEVPAFPRGELFDPGPEPEPEDLSGRVEEDGEFQPELPLLNLPAVPTMWTPERLEARRRFFEPLGIVPDSPEHRARYDINGDGSAILKPDEAVLERRRIRAAARPIGPVLSDRERAIQHAQAVGRGIDV